MSVIDKLERVRAIAIQNDIDIDDEMYDLLDEAISDLVDLDSKLLEMSNDLY